MDIELFLQMLQIDSTSGREGEFAAFLAERLLTEKCRLKRFPVETMADSCPEGYPLPENLLFSWGTPKVIFCTHLDTVPPYISPEVEIYDGTSSPPVALRQPRGACRDCSATSGAIAASVFMENLADASGTALKRLDSSLDVCQPESSHCHPERSEGSFNSVISGRGACDAKGQIFAMYSACLELEKQGCTDFGLLLLAGEETGSFGAKAFNQISGQAASDDVWLVVGEPTDNCMASAAKGTKSFEIEFEGEAFHSGYPQHGRSAVMMFNDFVNALRSIGFPQDHVLGETTWNIGKLHSDNPQNILSDRLTCRAYFRTTFESDEMVCNVMKNIAGPDAKLRFGRPRVQDGSDIVAKEVADWQKYMKVTAFGGDAPTRFEVLDGFPTKPVSFGSDAPQLTAFKHKILCGPGSILVAHRDDEHITLHDLETAVQNYIDIYKLVVE